MKIKLLILEKDEIYLKRITDVFNNKYTNALEVYSFTNKERALICLKESAIDVALISDLYSIEDEGIPNRCGIAYFVNNSEIETINGRKAIYKFSQIEVIYKHILSVYAENAPEMKKKLNNNIGAKIINFIPVSGGVGSSTMSVAFAKYMAIRGKRVCYLNMEELGITEKYFYGEGENNIGDIIYAIKSKKSNLSLKIKSIVKKDTSGVDFFESSKRALDMKELSEEELILLLHEIEALDEYEYIILDSDFSLNKKAIEILKESTYIILTSDGSEVSNNKFGRAYEAFLIIEQQEDMDLVGKMKLVYNKFRSKTSSQIESQIEIIGGVPKYEGATERRIIEQICHMDIFDKIS